MFDDIKTITKGILNKKGRSHDQPTGGVGINEDHRAIGHEVMEHIHNGNTEGMVKGLNSLISAVMNTEPNGEQNAEELDDIGEMEGSSTSRSI